MNHTDTPSFSAPKSAPWWISLLAILEIIFGFILLSFPFVLSGATIWVGGFLFIAAGFFRMIQGIRHLTNKAWNFLAALAYLVIGVLMVVEPIDALVVWTMVIGFALLAVGVFRLALAFMLTQSPGSAWRFINSIITLILGGLVLGGWPESSAWFIGTVVAIEMIFSGWTLLFFSLTPKTR